MRINEQSLCDPRAKTLTISAKNVITEAIQYTYMNVQFMHVSILMQSCTHSVDQSQKSFHRTWNSPVLSKPQRPFHVRI